MPNSLDYERVTPSRHENRSSFPEHVAQSSGIRSNEASLLHLGRRGDRARRLRSPGAYGIASLTRRIGRDSGIIVAVRAYEAVKAGMTYRSRTRFAGRR